MNRVSKTSRVSHVPTQAGLRRLLAAAAVSLSFAAAAGPDIAVPEGAPVDRIPGADQISGWEQVGPDKVMLQVGRTNRYLLTLQTSCPLLRHTDALGVSMSNNTIWAGFDYVSAEGMRCEIRSISQVTATTGRAHLDS